MELKHISPANDRNTVYHPSTTFSIAPPRGKIGVHFSGGRLTTDAGARRLRQVDQKIRLAESIKLKMGRKWSFLRDDFFAKRCALRVSL